MPDTATLAATSGLITTARTPVPLAGVTVDADVRALSARVTVAQRYVNRETVPIEATYVFPLDEGAAVCAFEAVIDGVRVVGRVREREEAFRVYDDAMEAGHGAYLLDEERPDVFQASIGNLPAGCEVLVTITYVTELRVDAGEVRLVVPTTVSPRYAPAADRASIGRPDAETLNPPQSLSVPYGLTFSMRVAADAGVTRIESPTHPIGIDFRAGGAVVSLAQREVALDRDIAIVMSGEALAAPHAWIERSPDGSHALAVGFVPVLESGAAPLDVVFLVDRSGSMQGDSIAEVRNALQLCLRSMCLGSSFNIVGFGSTIEALFPESRDYTEETLAAASAHVAGLDGDLGGTEILPALQQVLGQPAAGGRVRQVVVLTDGQITNTDAVLALTRRSTADARVFTFGIGAGASRHLVSGLARAGRGEAEFIAPGERIEPKVVRLFQRLNTPAMCDVRIDWGGLEVRPATSGVPPVFAGTRFLVYGFVEALRETTVRVAARTPTGLLAFDVAVDPVTVPDGATIGTLAARARIRELEESPEWTSARASQQGRSRVTNASAEIQSLALKYQLVSRETSFVAVEERETPVSERAQLRKVPVALTTGWGGVLGRVRRVRARPSGPAEWPGDMDALALPSAMPGSVRLKSARGGGIPGTPAGARMLHRGRVFERSRVPDSTDRMMAVVSLQQADGHWELDSALADALGRSRSTIALDLPDDAGARGVVRKAWATALALAWLTTEAAALESMWQLVADKGRAWLRNQGEDADESVERARRWLSAHASR